MELGPQPPENKSTTRPLDSSSNGEEEARPPKRPKRDHKRSSSRSFPEDSGDEERVKKYLEGLNSITDELEDLHKREQEFHLDHQERYERLRGMIANTTTWYLQQIYDKEKRDKRRLQEKLKQERQLNAGKAGAASDVPSELASTPPQISEPESHKDRRAPHTGKHRANLRAASPAARFRLIGEDGGTKSYTTPRKLGVQILQGFQNSRKQQLASTPWKNSPTRSALNANSRFQAMELSEDEPPRPRPPLGYKGKKPDVDPVAVPAAGALRQDKLEPLPANYSSRWKATRSNSPKHAEPSDGDDEDNGDNEVEAEALPDPESSEQSIPMGALREDGVFYQPAGVPTSNDPPRAVLVEEDEVSNFSVSLSQHPESSEESSVESGFSESGLAPLLGRKTNSPLASLSARKNNSPLASLSARKNFEAPPFDITPESSQTLPNGTAAVTIKRPIRECRNNGPGTYNVVLDLGEEPEGELGLQTRPKKNLPPKRAPKGDSYVPEDSAQRKSRSHSPTKPTLRLPQSARKLHKPEPGQTKIPRSYFTGGSAASTIGKAATGASGANGTKPDQRPRNILEMTIDEGDDEGGDLEADAGSSVGTLQHPPGMPLSTDDIIKSLPPPPPIRKPRQVVRFSRKVIQKTIGGAPRGLINDVAEPMSHDYPVDHYLCSNGNLNIFLPHEPGMHGAMLVFRSGQMEVGSEWHLFVSATQARPQENTHEYFGYYVVTDDTDMPHAEWTNQSLKFQNAWSKDIAVKSKTSGGWVHKSLEHWGLTGTGAGVAVTQEQVKRWFNVGKEGRGEYARLGRRFLQFKAFDKDLYEALVRKKKELAPAR